MTDIDGLGFLTNALSGVTSISPHLIDSTKERSVKVAAQKSHITYDEVVAALPQLDPEGQVDLLQVLSKVLKKNVALRKAGKHSLLELEGLGAEIWNSVDIDAYVRRERESWD